MTLNEDLKHGFFSSLSSRKSAQAQRKSSCNQTGFLRAWLYASGIVPASSVPDLLCPLFAPVAFFPGVGDQAERKNRLTIFLRSAGFSTRPV
jgi:hypothetical protein